MRGSRSPALRENRAGFWPAATAACFALWALSTGFALHGTTVSITGGLRILASLMLIAAVVAVLRSHRRTPLLSPLVLLAGLTLGLYGWAPCISALIGSERRLGGVYSWIVAYVGSTSELLIVGFVFLCLAAFGLLVLLLGIRQQPANPRSQDLEAPNVGTAAIVVTALCAGSAAASLAASNAGWIRDPRIVELIRAIVPWTSVGVAALAHAATGRSRPFALVSASIAVLGALALLVHNQAVMPLLIVFSGLLLYLVGAEAGRRRAVVVALVGVGAIGGMLAILATSRILPQLEGVGFVDRLATLAEFKLIHRQGVSAGCFHRIATARLGRDATGDPFYFRMAIIPRVIWPDKPNLSRGGEFAEIHCGMAGAIANRHSESITLLGEPILEAGLAGMFVAEATVIALLFGASYLGLAGGPVRLIALAAMLPWLIHVQQHFAFYIAAVFKSALLMVPLLLLFGWLVRRRARTAAMPRLAG